jgi:hypothetical protein
MSERGPVHFSRRGAIAGGLASIVAVWTGAMVAPEAEAEQMTVEERRALLEKYSFLWAATSPATHKGDSVELELTNRGGSLIIVSVNTIIMDHTTHHNEPAIKREVQVEAGESLSLTGSNDYGAANHFSTRMFADTGDPEALGVTVTVKNAVGRQTTTFNELAFWVKSVEDLRAEAEMRHGGDFPDRGHHDHS